MTRHDTGVTVELLDYTLLAAACDEHQLNRPAYGSNGILRRASDGAAVIISSEGVGSTKITEGMVYLDTEWVAEWQCLPLAAAEACRTGETRDLAHLVRTFGHRLDANVHDWKTWALS